MTREDLRADLIAGLTVTCLSVPQGIAYAMIAGLPPAMGLYAAALPAVVGSLLRSSQHVVTGPSNAVSLLVGSVLIGRGDPVAAAVTLACMVGALQVLAGLMRLGAVVDFISKPVVLGYITGAAVLLILGQLPNLTGTVAGTGPVLDRARTWAGGAGAASGWSLGIGLGTALIVWGLKRFDRRVPGPLLVMAAGIGLGFSVDLRALGVSTVADVAPVPAGWPPLTLPDSSLMGTLWSGALACTLLSLVESSSVARSLSTRSGQRLQLSTEFVGQGMANLAAGLTGGYPTSGSLARSSLNASAGARTRMSGALSGVLMLLVVLVAGPVFDHTPVACLAGLIIVTAIDLFDPTSLRATLRSGVGDRAGFLITMAGTWLLPLDTAIELGVGISLLLYLRRARLLVVRDMGVDGDGHLQEREFGQGMCGAIRVLHLEGALFFGAAGELQSALDAVAADPNVKVLVVRLKRTQGLDVTTADVLSETAERLRTEGRTLLLAGMRQDLMQRLERTGAAQRVGRENLFATEPGWFVAMQRAMQRAAELAGAHGCEDACPVEAYVAQQHEDVPR